MTEQEVGLFTVGVFADVQAAGAGLAALERLRIPASLCSVIALASPDVSALVERCLGARSTMSIAGIGEAVVAGPLVEALQGTARDLALDGLAGTMRRVGFQPHDARIFEALVARGGVLVAVQSESRAADVLAILHAYGGGNAAIGAWTGRL
jgi:hypothetical protein